MNSASSASIGAPEILLSATHAALHIRSVGGLMLTITRKIGTRVVTRQSQDNFVPRRGIMLQASPHFLFLFTLLSFS